MTDLTDEDVAMIVTRAHEGRGDMFDWYAVWSEIPTWNEKLDAYERRMQELLDEYVPGTDFKVRAWVVTDVFTADGDIRWSEKHVLGEVYR